MLSYFKLHKFYNLIDKLKNRKIIVKNKENKGEEISKRSVTLLNLFFGRLEILTDYLLNTYTPRKFD